MSGDRYNEPSLPPVSDYGTAWITGGTRDGLVIHTVLKRRKSGLSLSQSPTLCGRKVVWLITTEAALKERMRGYPLCKKCEERMS